MKTNKARSQSDVASGDDTVVEARRADTPDAWQQYEIQALRLLCGGSSLEDSLAVICQGAMEQFPRCGVSIHRITDSDPVMRFVASAGLPREYGEAFDALGIQLDDPVASGDELSVIEDLRQDDRFKSLCVACQHQVELRSGWTMPIVDDSRRVIGSVTIYSVIPGPPTRSYLLAMRDFVSVVSSLNGVHLQLEDRDDRARKMARAAGIVELGNLAGQVAHRFNNVLSGIIANAELIRLVDQSGSTTEEVERICEAGISAAQLCRELLLMAGKGSLEFKQIDLVKFVGSTVGRLADRIPENLNITVRYGEPTTHASVDPELLRRSIISLITGSICSMRSIPGNIKISVKMKYLATEQLPNMYVRGTMEKGNYVRIRIENDARGLSCTEFIDALTPEHLDIQAEDRFGLAAVIGIIGLHHGGINLTTGERHNYIDVFLPVSPQTATDVTHSTADSTGHRILLVDDEDVVRESLRKLLTVLGCEVAVARSGNEAVSMFPTICDSIDVALIDQRMPGMGGTETGIQLRKSNPKLPIVFISGYCDYNEGSNEQPVLDDITSTLEKPLRAETLLDELSRVIAQAGDR